MSLDRLASFFEDYPGPRMSPTSMLLFGSAVFGVLLIVLQNMGEFPLHLGDLLFFSVIFLLFSLYRPAWAFLSFVFVLPFEIVNFAPSILPMNLRPYQLFGGLIAIALLVLFVRKKLPRKKLSFGWVDIFPFLVVFGGFLGAANASEPGAAFKQSVVLLSFGLLYVIGRVFIRTAADLRMALRFLLVSSLLVALYALYQNLRFLSGGSSFEVMPGRPNSVFPEADWLGMYFVLFGAILFSIGQMFMDKKDDGSRAFHMAWHPVLFVFLTLFFVVLLITVSRSAWLGVFVMAVVSTSLFAYRERSAKPIVMYVVGIAGAFILAFALVALVPLTRFDLAGRAGSIGDGLQSITVACDRADTNLPQVLHTMDELADNGCRHIDLEDIDAQQAMGNSVMTVFRPDPNVNIRREIYVKSFDEIAKHPIFGIGWGSISVILGTDARGAGLNASNLFLETWLGSGLLGLLALLGFLGMIVFRAGRSFLSDRSVESIFILSVFAGLLVANLFNAGLFQGYMWILFAIGASTPQKETGRSSASSNN